MFFVCVDVCIFHVFSGMIRKEMMGNEELRLRKWELEGIYANINSCLTRRKRVFKAKKVHYVFIKF